MSTSSCPLCTSRKARRACPALERSICPVCCGTKRLVEIKCPSSCPFLSSARAHPAAVLQRRREKDLRFVLPLVADLSEAQYRLLLLFQLVTARHAERATFRLTDQDVADGAAAAAATLETAGKGIIYEHQATSLPAQQLASELLAALDEVLKEAATRAGAIERDAAVALRRIEQGARTAAKALPDDEPPVYVSLLGRIASQGGRAEGTPEPQAEPASRLIIP